MGDRFFDLANFSVNHGLDEDGDRELLDAYFGEAPTTTARASTLMRFMSDFREAMWGVVQQAVSELDFDFVAYADEHFERLERPRLEPRFRRGASDDPGVVVPVSSDPPPTQPWTSRCSSSGTRPHPCDVELEAIYAAPVETESGIRPDRPRLEPRHAPRPQQRPLLGPHEQGAADAPRTASARPAPRRPAP